MPPIVVNQFKGYTSEKDGFIDDPALGSDCENIVIYNGAICNIPYYNKKFTPNFWILANELLASHYYMSHESIMVAYNNNDGDLHIAIKDSAGDFDSFVTVDPDTWMS